MIAKSIDARRSRLHDAQRRTAWPVVLFAPLCLIAVSSLANTETESASVAAAGAADASLAGGGLDEVVVTGTRETNVKARDSVAPIDVISATELTKTGATDLRDALERTLPSLNHQSFSGDLGNLTDSIQLRGLSPDDVLILVNGKRRHTTASIYADSDGPLQGSAPVDIDLIPISAVDHIEVLRDGAAAQYGSDAIAGVVNIILKSSDHGGDATVTTGQYYGGDGFTGEAGVGRGLRLGEDGFLHLSADYLHHDHSVRSGPDSRTGVVDNDIFGDPLINRISLAYNAGKAFANDAAEVYSFATYAHRDAESYENYRLPTVIPSIYPNGFSPQETIAEDDFSVTAGVKGNDLLGWHWDLASTYGGDDDHFGLKDSGNPSLLAATGSTPTSFDIASFKTGQWTNNLDLVRPFDIGAAGPLSVALGAEWRRDTYAVGAGDKDSYIDGGAQSFQGLAPINAGSYSRSNYAGYIDLATNPVEHWQVDLAGRYEHYTDFGRTTSGKLSTRYDFSPRLALRATVSNGFRAPSLAQEYFSDLNVSPTGASGQLAAHSPAAALLGATQLEPEKSSNFSVGFVAEPIEGLHAALDAYLITIKNRIVDGGTYAGTQAINALAANGITLPPGIDPADVSAVYFSHADRARRQRQPLAECADRLLSRDRPAAEQDHPRRNVAEHGVGGQPARNPLWEERPAGHLLCGPEHLLDVGVLQQHRSAEIRHQPRGGVRMDQRILLGVRRQQPLRRLSEGAAAGGALHRRGQVRQQHGPRHRWGLLLYPHGVQILTGFPSCRGARGVDARRGALDATARQA
jgi:iron complex outermembrane receptor protein